MTVPARATVWWRSPSGSTSRWLKNSNKWRLYVKHISGSRYQASRRKACEVPSGAGDRAVLCARSRAASLAAPVRTQSKHLLIVPTLKLPELDGPRYGSRRARLPAFAIWRLSLTMFPVKHKRCSRHSVLALSRQTGRRSTKCARSLVLGCKSHRNAQLCSVFVKCK